MPPKPSTREAIEMILTALDVLVVMACGDEVNDLVGEQHTLRQIAFRADLLHRLVATGKHERKLQ